MNGGRVFGGFTFLFFLSLSLLVGSSRRVHACVRFSLHTQTKCICYRLLNAFRLEMPVRVTPMDGDECYYYFAVVCVFVLFV